MTSFFGDDRLFNVKYKKNCFCSVTSRNIHIFGLINFFPILLVNELQGLNTSFKRFVFFSQEL